MGWSKIRALTAHVYSLPTDYAKGSIAYLSNLPDSDTLWASFSRVHTFEDDYI